MKLLKLSIGIMMLLLLTAPVNPILAEPKHQVSSGKITIETDTLVVEIVGGSNIPSFTFWKLGEDNTTYKVKFDQVFEVIDNNTNGQYDLDEDKRVPNSQVSLAALTWEFSEFDVVKDDNNETTEIHFNITSLDNQNGPGKKDLTVQFRNHIYSSNDAELKFDIILDNYEFKDENALLVFGFKLITSNNEETVQNQDEIQFGDGFFQSEETAEANGTTLNVGLSTGTEGGDNKIFLAYEHFEGNLTHDPTIGVQGSVQSQETDDVTSDQKSGILPDLSKGGLFTSSILATLLFIAIPTIIYQVKVRRKSI